MAEIELAAVVRPGDTLVVAVTDRLTAEEIGNWREDFRVLTDQGIEVVVIEAATSLVVARYDDDSELDKEFPE